ncbi:hypothetical protein Dtox_3675 [Desulfofarcimen acetoxidans DSM 771]|uniref:Uncharacterized protein n=1 Tax=Desulfofarcimen acetoxidans (strain ATCC 49208 / DSM 771 / KCTC 5769 / VKM B-1644 / 5575) TaxID=485916 RepID=C8VWM0_DESAS|nr:hypothetical protein [Desulfofarcimen acetoxidans]ACV64384.1 hypothetical protein Dtox_3675 [Desulfofarcimen acetoxidans DSM 771]
MSDWEICEYCGAEMDLVEYLTSEPTYDYNDIGYREVVECMPVCINKQCPSKVRVDTDSMPDEDDTPF